MTTPYASDDDLLRHHGSTSRPSTAESAMPSSPKPGKKVNWGHIPRPDSPDENAPPPSSQSLRPNPPLEEAQLRQQVHEIFRQHSPVTVSPTTGDPQGSIPSVKFSQPSKPALRVSGASTPVLPALEELDIADHEGKLRSLNVARDKAHRLSKSLGDIPEAEHLSSEEEGGRPRRKREENKKGKKSKSSSRAIFDLFYDGHEVPQSGQTTPDACDTDYVPKPSQYRTAGLSAMALLDRVRGLSSTSRRSSIDEEIGSGRSTPTLKPAALSRSPQHSPNPSLSSIASLATSSYAQGGSIVGSTVGADLLGRARQAQLKRPSNPRSYSDGQVGNSGTSTPIPRSSSTGFLDALGKKARKLRSSSSSNDTEALIVKKHIEETRSRQLYLLKLSRALMVYGAPTHRLEEYMKMSARALQTEAQFLYLPGCMIISFDDSQTHTTEVKLVRHNGGMDLGKLRDVHDVYKEVVHDHIGVEEASVRLDDIFMQRDKFNIIWQIFAHGLASATVGPFAFDARYIDIAPAFILGCLVGCFRVIVTAWSDLHAAVAEVLAVVVTSFLSRWLGSLKGGKLFCFAALAQSSIVLILPGYIVLMGALELQYRSLVAGAARLVYAIFFSVFLGFSLTIGTALYGLADKNASSNPTCIDPLRAPISWVFVPIYTIAIMIIFQAKYKQMPVMLIISLAAYVVTEKASEEFKTNPAISSTIGAAAIGLMANTYSRLGMKCYRACDQFWKWIRTTIASMHGRGTNDPERQPSTQLDGAQEGGTPSGVTIAMEPLAGPSEPLPIPDTEASSEMRMKANKRVRVGYSLAATAMLPAILVQVPSGLSVAGSLLEGIQNADQLVFASSNGSKSSASASASASPTPSPGSVTGMLNGTSTTPSNLQGDNSLSSGLTFTVGYSVVQIAIGITVGLCCGACAVYPLGKGGKVSWWKQQGKLSRSGMFSF